MNPKPFVSHCIASKPSRARRAVLKIGSRNLQHLFLASAVADPNTLLEMPGDITNRIQMQMPVIADDKALALSVQGCFRQKEWPSFGIFRKMRWGT
ncbi:hypothetical protein CCGE525_35540 (plasmid) [Rhizobium jaguaris]|uniref:Uncharacterized protein n=1 Tax=Rhizobium jaguaris TaxID=1312183 RepID=A0A387FZM2_9HYPH|nr:hypothetical protein CCGE525_35540 [Rhizobium jaguaris]